MSASALICGVALLCATTPPTVPRVSLDAPAYHVAGEPYVVTLRVTAPEEAGAVLPAWSLSAASFAVDGVALGERPAEGELVLVAGQVLETTLDLSPALGGVEAGADLELAWEGDERSTVRQPLSTFKAAETGIDFLQLPAAQLGDYHVLMLTTQGDMWVELWPDSAPNHVRNFLDLAYTGFYDGTQFHRVIPGFMAQGGRAKQGSKAPRKVAAEFSTRRHLRGVLSAARLGQDINSADSEFFVMHAEYPTLDGKYSAFGKLIMGIEAVDRLVETRDKRYPFTRPEGYTPSTPQFIERAIVVKARPRPQLPENGGEDR